MIRLKEKISESIRTGSWLPSLIFLIIMSSLNILELLSIIYVFQIYIILIIGAKNLFKIYQLVRFNVNSFNKYELMYLLVVSVTSILSMYFLYYFNNIYKFSLFFLFFEPIVICIFILSLSYLNLVKSCVSWLKYKVYNFSLSDILNAVMYTFLAYYLIGYLESIDVCLTINGEKSCGGHIPYILLDLVNLIIPISFVLSVFIFFIENLFMNKNLISNDFIKIESTDKNQ